MSTQSPLADLRNTSLVPPLPTPRRLSKMSQNRHSLYSTPSSNGFEQGPLSVGASPENTPAPRPPHSRATSLLNFSFRNRTSSHPSNQAQNQTQQPLQPIRENPGAPSTGDRNTTSEFGRMSVPLGPGQAVKAVASQSSGGSPIQDQQQKPPIEPPRRAGSLMNTAQQLHPEIRSIVELCVAHAHKVYFSGPLVKHIERHSDGKIVGKEEPWRDVWAQLGGTTLSVWDMKQIEEANKRGEEVPPTYLNITDAVSIIYIISMRFSHRLVVRSCLRCCHDARRKRHTCEALQRRHSYNCWHESTSLLLSESTGVDIVDSSSAISSLREITTRGDLYCASTTNVTQRTWSL